MRGGWESPAVLLMYWSATGKSAHFSLTVLNDLKKRQINLWWQDQTRKKANRRGLYCFKIHVDSTCTDAQTRVHKHSKKRLQCKLEQIRRQTRTQWPQTLLCQAPQKWERSSDERLEDNWWYFCAGASSTVKQISHLLCRWVWTVDWRFGSRNLSLRGGGNRSHNSHDNVTATQAGAASRANEWAKESLDFVKNFD